MDHHICVTCGAQFAATTKSPSNCPICDDERQYVGHQGQRWTTLTELRRDHRNTFEEVAPDLTGIATEPRFAIGQQAHLIETPAGNVLWNCISLIDDDPSPRSSAVVDWRQSPSPTRISSLEWLSGARRSAACRSTSMPTIARG